MFCCGFVKVVVVLCGGVQLEWRKGKVNPFVSRIRARLGPKAMPLNIVHDKDGLPRIILTEPTGSSAEVCFTIIIIYSFFLNIIMDLFLFVLWLILWFGFEGSYEFYDWKYLVVFDLVFTCRWCCLNFEKKEKRERVCDWRWMDCWNGFNGFWYIQHKKRLKRCLN